MFLLPFSEVSKNFKQHLNTFVDFSTHCLRVCSQSTSLSVPVKSLSLVTHKAAASLHHVPKEISGDLETARYVLPAESERSCARILQEKQCMQEKSLTTILISFSLTTGSINHSYGLPIVLPGKPDSNPLLDVVHS